MFIKHKIGVVIPAFNEEEFILKTLVGLPSFVDKIIVIDDGSTDGTSKKITNLTDSRLVLIQNKKNKGVGYSIKKGLQYFLINDEVDIVCLVSGDNQCDTKYLKNMIQSLIHNDCDYAKSNRFIDTKALKSMPRHRFLGNILFTLLTKFATGYYSIFDALNAFSATRIKTIAKMSLEEIADGYDFDVSYLLQHALINSKVKDFPTPARYADEVSNINYLSFIIITIKTLIVGYFRRIIRKYIIYNFHPIALFLILGILFFLVGILFCLFILIRSLQNTPATTTSILLFVIPFILGIQLILQAIILDMQAEPK